MEKIFKLFLVVIFVGTFLNAKEYVIGVENIKYYPHYSVEKGEYVGYAREVFDLFASKKGYKFTYKPLPIKRLFNDFLNGSLDFKYPDNPYWQKGLKEGKNVLYSKSVTEYIDGVMVKTENRGSVKLKKLGTVMGFTPWEFLSQIEKKEIVVKENKSFDNLLKQTIAGRVDGAYINTSIAKYNLEKTKSSGKLIFDKTLPFTKSSYLISTMKHPKILKEFNQFLKSNEKEIGLLKRKYKIELD